MQYTNMINKKTWHTNETYCKLLKLTSVNLLTQANNIKWNLTMHIYLSIEFQITIDSYSMVFLSDVIMDKLKQEKTWLTNNEKKNTRYHIFTMMKTHVVIVLSKNNVYSDGTVPILWRKTLPSSGQFLKC